MGENPPKFGRKFSKIWEKIIQNMGENPPNYGRKSSKLWMIIPQSWNMTVNTPC